MGRKQLVSTQALIAATTQAITARDDGSWSLADVAACAGVTPAAIVKRFGTKQGLLVAVTTAWADDFPVYDQAATPDPLAHIEATLTAWVDDVCDPARAIGNLTLLFDELRDPVARAALRRGLDAQATHLHDALRDAHSRKLIATQPELAAVQLWLDLLTGAAFRCAADHSRSPGTRALASITRDIERWKLT